MLSALCIVHFSNASRLAEKPCLIQAKDTISIWLKVINVKTYDTKQLRDDDFVPSETTLFLKLLLASCVGIFFWTTLGLMLC